MTPGHERVSNQTREHHFTEPVETSKTTSTVERHVHRLPAEWYVATTPEYNLNTYESYERNPEYYPDVARQRVTSVEFDYEEEPVADGSGKPYTVMFVTTEAEESGAGREVREEWTKYSRTGDLLGVLDYDEKTYEVVQIVPTEEGEGVLVTIQKHLSHLPIDQGSRLWLREVL